MTAHNHERKAASRGRMSPALAAGALVVWWSSAPAIADITNDATAAATYGATAVTSNSSNAAVPVVPAAPALDVLKTGILVDSDTTPGTSAGDRIDYTVTVRNAGNVSVSTVVLNDPLVSLSYLSGDAGTPAVLDVAETWTYTGSYTLTQADLDGNGGGDGDIDNTVTVTAVAGSTPLAASTSAETPLATTASLAVTKTPSVTSGVRAGDVVTYTYVVTNTGNQTVTAISMSDAHDGSGAPPVPGSEQLSADLRSLGDSTDLTANDGVWDVLAPGDSVTFTATYTITQTDVDTRQ